MNLVQNLLKHKLRVCGTVRLNIGIPYDLEKEAEELKRGQFTFICLSSSKHHNKQINVNLPTHTGMNSIKNEERSVVFLKKG